MTQIIYVRLSTSTKPGVSQKKLKRGEQNNRKQKLLTSDITVANRLFQELKNTAKTRGHRVTKMTLQIPIFPMSSPNKCEFFAKIQIFSNIFYV